MEYKKGDLVQFLWAQHPQRIGAIAVVNRDQKPHELYLSLTIIECPRDSDRIGEGVTADLDRLIPFDPKNNKRSATLLYKK